MVLGVLDFGPLFPSPPLFCVFFIFCLVSRSDSSHPSLYHPPLATGGLGILPLRPASQYHPYIAVLIFQFCNFVIHYRVHLLPFSWVSDCWNLLLSRRTIPITSSAYSRFQYFQLRFFIISSFCAVFLLCISLLGLAIESTDDSDLLCIYSLIPLFQFRFLSSCLLLL